MYRVEELQKWLELSELRLNLEHSKELEAQHVAAQQQMEEQHHEKLRLQKEFQEEVTFERKRMESWILISPRVKSATMSLGSTP